MGAGEHASLKTGLPGRNTNPSDFSQAIEFPRKLAIGFILCGSVNTPLPNKPLDAALLYSKLRL